MSVEREGSVEAAKRASPAHVLPDSSIDLLDGTVGDTLRQTAQRFADRPALMWSGERGIETMSYRELLDETERVAAWLLDRAAPGDRIGIWSRNSVDWVLLEYGCALAGMVVASWNPAWTDHECRHALELTEPALLFADRDTRGVPLLDRAVAIAGQDRTFPLDGLRELVSESRPGALPQVQPADLFLIQFTSGTTGRAKGASLSHRAALNGGWIRARLADGDETDVWLNPIPLNHMGGAISMVLGAMTSGACYVVMHRFDVGEYLRMMRECGATRIGGVPTMILSLADHPDWTPGSFHVRSIGSGGAQVPRPLIERLMREFEAPVIVTYAQSECPFISATVATDSAQAISETVGRPAPHVEVKICGLQDGGTLAVGETGEVCVRAPVVMEGYYRMPEATAQTIDADGFLHTGDLGSLDERGYLRISGRAREVIIRGGENIYPAEVEDCLLEHPGIHAAAVVPIPDERWGQVVGAAVQLREGHSPTTQELEEHAGTRIAHFKVPRHWLFVDSFPLTPSGKIRKVEVEEMFAEG
ncbi:MAG: class I adenylate-forming enzyme family protein [Novosphingobium sp.]|nr:acyl--CoA ligase [Novosphingobium sp.]